jgi:hypothetical protein
MATSHRDVTLVVSLKGEELNLVKFRLLAAVQDESFSGKQKVSEADGGKENIFHLTINTFRTGIFCLYINHKSLIQSKVTFF